MASPPGGGQNPFSERYLVASYADGGVVVDLQSGNYYRVNRTAALVCETLGQQADRTVADRFIANELRVDEAEASRIVDHVVSDLGSTRIHGEIQGSYHFYPTETGYELRHGGRRVLNIFTDDSRIEIEPTAASTMTASQLELYVRAFAPKLLFQAGIAMLHASACLIDQSLIAFSGLSGAGKTTTAQALQGAGAKLVSEELLVFAPDGPSAVVITGGEALVFEWSRTAASELFRERRCSASMTSLIADLGSGSTNALQEIVFLDNTRRRGIEFTTERLQGASALAELFRHHFLGAAETEAWRRFFRVAVALVESVEMRLGWSPEGIDCLPGAAARYISRTVSKP